MNWKFTILNQGNAILVEEPVGFDSMSIVIKRDPTAHGVFFDYQANEFNFYGKAADILRREKKLNGIDGSATLIIEQQCNGAYSEVYRGNFDFGIYSDTCGSECFVKIPLEATGDVMLFRNKIDQKVDLESLVAFDETTSLPQYEWLGKEMDIPSKGIYIKDDLKVSEAYSKPFGGAQPTDPDPAVDFAGWTQVVFGFDGPVVAEIGVVQNDDTLTEWFIETGAGAPPVFATTLDGTADHNVNIRPLDLSPLIDIRPDGPNYTGINNPVDVNLRIKGELSIQNCSVGAFALIFGRLPSNTENVNQGEFDTDYDWKMKREIFYNLTIPDQLQPGQSLPFDIIFSQPFDFVKDDKFYFFFIVFDRKTPSQWSVVDGGQPAYTISLHTESFFKAENLSKTPPTNCKVFMINEALSRTVEAITNGQLRSYSDYFGRVDSLPYSHLEDGCGALEVITKGLFLRQQEKVLTDRPPIFSLSFRDILDGINPIHNIGFGIEPDSNRPGFNRLRIEPWKYFYSNDVLMTCMYPDRVDLDMDAKGHYSLFEFGYDKWEAEEYTGLDEFLTRRTFRTTLNSISNTLTQLSKFIASGYALEITRRKGNSDSADWRFDNETFILCVVRDGEIKAEQGGVMYPENIIDPDTLFNYRISPIRNAMRWMDVINEGYVSGQGKIIFTTGDGNYYAKGMLPSACSPESVPISENQVLGATDFKVAPVAIRRAERISFNYPMSAAEFKAIKENPRGLIRVVTECDDVSGWIDEINYKPSDGTASFKLIPKR